MAKLAKPTPVPLNFPPQKWHNRRKILCVCIRNCNIAHMLRPQSRNYYISRSKLKRHNYAKPTFRNWNDIQKSKWGCQGWNFKSLFFGQKKSSFKFLFGAPATQLILHSTRISAADIEVRRSYDALRVLPLNFGMAQIVLNSKADFRYEAPDKSYISRKIRNSAAENVQKLCHLSPHCCLNRQLTSIKK